MPDMSTADTRGEVAVFKGMIHVVTRIAGAGVVAYPSFAIVDVGNVGMARLVTEVAVLFDRVRG
jgi:hypothetical protein